MGTQIIHIHPEAPDKPPLGQPCNGCGICCAAEPCPVSLVFLWPHQTPCRALQWSAQDNRYFCGMITHPTEYARWIPRRLQARFIQIIKRWIASGQGCDSDAQLER